MSAIKQAARAIERSWWNGPERPPEMYPRTAERLAHAAITAFLDHVEPEELALKLATDAGEPEPARHFNLYSPEARSVLAVLRLKAVITPQLGVSETPSSGEK